MTNAMALQLPSSYVLMDAEEMEYVEGGLTVSRTFFVWTISIAAGAGITALTGGVGTLFANASLKLVLSSYELRYAFAKTIVKAIGALGINVGNMIPTIAGGISGCGLGDLAGYIFDNWIDGLDGVMDRAITF